jgi:hypothetical protein
MRSSVLDGSSLQPVVAPEARHKQVEKRSAGSSFAGKGSELIDAYVSRFIQCLVFGKLQRDIRFDTIGGRGRWVKVLRSV